MPRRAERPTVTISVRVTWRWFWLLLSAILIEGLGKSLWDHAGVQAVWSVGMLVATLFAAARTG